MNRPARLASAISLFFGLSLAFSAWLAPAVMAANSGSSEIKDEVDELNGQVKVKRDRVKELESLIKGYQGRIKTQEEAQSTLQNEILLLETRIKEKELDIERAKAEIEALTLEIQLMDEQIKQTGARIEKQKSLVADLMRRVHQSDSISTIDVFLTRPSLSAFFNRVEELKRLQKSLAEALERMKQTKRGLESDKKTRDDKRLLVLAREKEIRKTQLALAGEKNYKVSLVSETQQNQQEYERALYELRQQQQDAASDISELEQRLKDTLASVDQSLARGDVLLNWPVEPIKGLSTTFRDPTYPFRRMFEHSGIDIPVEVGTTVRAAAGGYVAWNKRGRLYGNYLMIVHPGNIATVYAHLSRFVAKGDTFVERGDVVALSGGRAGDPGAGLSTGPHLHFEVRQNGIPINPENFLPTRDEE